MSEQSDDSQTVVRRDLVLPSRETTTGRGHGHGKWLESECERALRRWGYATDHRVRAYDMEIDVIGRRRNPQHRPNDCVIAQCKDLADDPIRPPVIHRLCMLAFTCQAVPLLCHTSRLTQRAAKIANYWEVRVVRYPDLQRGTLPGPQIVDFTGRAYDPGRSSASMREIRGDLPELIRYRPHTGFSYVPGYQPTGKYGLYEPTVIDRRPESDK